MLFLRVPPWGGNRGINEVRHRLRLWEEEEFDELVRLWSRDCVLRRPQQFSNFDKDEHARRMIGSALRLVSKGNIGKAVKQLRAYGLGDVNDPAYKTSSSQSIRSGVPYLGQTFHMISQG